MAAHLAPHHRPIPRSGPRHHDGYGHFIASATRQRTLPAPQPRCAMASERWCYAARPAELTSSKTARATLRRLQSSIHHLLPRSAHHSPAPPRRQIAIDRHRPRRPPRVPSLEAFGRRPSARVDRSRRAGIRNPSQEEPFPARRLNGSFGWTPVLRQNARGRRGCADSDRSRDRVAIAAPTQTGPSARRAELRRGVCSGSFESHERWNSSIPTQSGKARQRSIYRSAPKTLALVASIIEASDPNSPFLFPGNKPGHQFGSTIASFQRDTKVGTGVSSV